MEFKCGLGVPLDKCDTIYETYVADTSAPGWPELASSGCATCKHRVAVAANTEQPVARSDVS